MNWIKTTIAAGLISLPLISWAQFTTSPQSYDSQQSTLLYHQMGEKNAPHLLLLGGGPGFSSWNLEPIQQQFADLGWQVTLMDMRGIGENRDALSPQQNSVTTWVEDIEQLRQTLNTEQVTLVGHSWGALMAMLYARQHPDKVRHMMLLNPVDPEKSGMQALTESIHQRNLKELNQGWDDDSAWDNEVKPMSSAEQLEQMTLKQITQVLPTYFYDYQQGQAYSKQFTPSDFDIELNVNTWKAYDANPITFEQINQWRFPIEFVECEQDPLMPYNLNAMQPNMKFASVTILQKCGHFPWIEQPDAFNQVLQKLSKSALSSSL